MLVQLADPKDRLFNHLDTCPNVPNEYFALSEKIKVTFIYKISQDLSKDMRCLKNAKKGVLPKDADTYFEDELYRMLTRTK